MDYILAELERQQQAMELLLAPSVDWPEEALPQKSAPGRQRRKPEAGTAQRWRGVPVEGSVGSAAVYRALVSAETVPDDEGGMMEETGGLSAGWPAWRAGEDAEEIVTKSAGGGRTAAEGSVRVRPVYGVAENVNAAYGSRTPVPAERAAARLTAQEVSRAVERDARRYDGGYQMH